MRTYETIVNMTGGTFQRLYIGADNIEQARATAERLIQTIPRYRIEHITEADPDTAAADVRADRASYMTADAQAQADHPATRTDYPAESDLQPASDTPSAHTTQHKARQLRTDTAPRTLEEAAARIEHINLNEVTGQIDGLYHRAIRQYLLSGKQWQLDLDWAILTAYAIGVQEGRRRERQRKKHSAPAI